MNENRFVEKIIIRDKSVTGDIVKSLKVFDVFTDGNGNYWHESEIEIEVIDDGNVVIRVGNEYIYVDKSQFCFLKETISFAEGLLDVQ